MLTGLLQSEHGVEFHDSVISPQLSMVQEELKEAGYATAAFVGGGFVGKQWGFDAGFDEFQECDWTKKKEELIDTPFREYWTDNGEGFDWAKEYLQNFASKQPVFLFVHTYMVHQFWIYFFPETMKMTDELTGPHNVETAQEGGPRFLITEYQKNVTLRQRRKLYAKAVWKCDEKLGEFLDFVRQSRTFHDAIIIITSDHGEGLGERHGKYLSLHHGKPPYAEQIDVPLIIYGLEKGRSDDLVGLDDIAGAILELAGIGQNHPKSLFRERQTLISEYISLMRKDSDRSVAFLTPKEKYFLSPDGNLHLYIDPKDSVDLLRLRQIDPKARDIPKDLRQQLDALGYLQ